MEHHVIDTCVIKGQGRLHQHVDHRRITAAVITSIDRMIIVNFGSCHCIEKRTVSERQRGFRAAGPGKSGNSVNDVASQIELVTTMTLR